MVPEKFSRLLNGGTTILHEVIKNGPSTELPEILSTYKELFDKIKHHLVRKFAWDPSDKIWLRKTILVATTEEQCNTTKQLEANSMSTQDIKQAIFVLLLSPVDGDDVAVIHPSETSIISAFHFITTVMPNGYLTFNYTGKDGTSESFIEVAASCGNITAINLLINLGAPLSLPGHNPLLAACRNLQRDTIRWLLTEHFDSFDCTLRSTTKSNALMVLMQKDDIEMLDYVLKKMINYRQKYFNDSQSQAFNTIFRYEHEVYTHCSILSSILSEPIRTKIEEYIVEYQLDLTYQWKGVTILADLLYKKLALDYCWDGIRKYPELLGLVVRQGPGTTIVHECIRLKILDILKEMYQLEPSVKRFFETNQAYETLQQALWNSEHDSVEFILENHQQFFLNNIGRLRNGVIFCSYHGKSFFVNNRNQLVKYFPSLEVDIDRVLSKKPAFSPDEDLKLAFKDVKLDDGNIQLPSSEPKTIRGSNGATLLHLAVEKDNLDQFAELLRAGCDFDAVDNNGNHPIHYVQSIEMFNTIVEQHPDGQSLVHRKNFTGHTVLHKVCQLSKNPPEMVVPLIEKVLSAGADINQPNNNGNPALFLVSNTTILDVLVRHGCKLDVVNNEGKTALEYRIRNRNMVIALLRLTHKLPLFKAHAHKYFAPLIFGNRVFFTQTYRPFLEANPDTLKILFDSLYENSPEFASELFNKACCNGQYFVVEKFLTFNYDLNYNVRDQDGSTCIVGWLKNMYGQRDDALVERLLAKGVDLEIRDKTGRNALLTFVGRFSSAECYEHSIKTVQLLLDHGARLDARDAAGNSALHLAFARGELELVEVLLRNGADFTAKNCNGEIPIQMGRRMHQELFFFIS